VRRGWLDGIVQFDIRKLLPADDSFLRLSRQRIPSLQIVKILLHNDVASPGESSVLLADQHGVHRRLPPRILRPIDETDQVTVVEVTEAMNFVHCRNGIPKARHDLRRKLEA